MRPLPIEVATGWLPGIVRREDDDLGWRLLSSPSPRQALEDAVLRGLQKQPCIVDFSGGRDSSLVLAVAAHVARREGLPLPIPRTNRFPLDPASNEDEWQEMVVRHLRLDHWEVSRVTDELDIVGERAQACLRKYGLLVPERLYTSTASLELARGGSYLTGEGGDEVLGPRRARFARVALQSPKVVVRSHAVGAVARNLVPRPARFLILWRHYSMAGLFPWLRPAPARQFTLALARSQAREPLSWRAFLRWHLQRRVPLAIAHNLALIAADYNVQSLQPLLDRAFVASLARCGGAYGFATRTDAMKFLADDLLPLALLGRETKPAFNTAYFTDVARDFANTWDGTGLDDGLVDPDKLRTTWLSPWPNASSFALLQAAWLTKHEKTATERPAGTGRATGT
jgi:Asparagine synthase